MTITHATGVTDLNEQDDAITTSSDNSSTTATMVINESPATTTNTATKTTTTVTTTNTATTVTATANIVTPPPSTTTTTTAVAVTTTTTTDDDSTTTTTVHRIPLPVATINIPTNNSGDTQPPVSTTAIATTTTTTAVAVTTTTTTDDDSTTTTTVHRIPLPVATINIPTNNSGDNTATTTITNIATTTTNTATATNNTATTNNNTATSNNNTASPATTTVSDNNYTTPNISTTENTTSTTQNLIPISSPQTTTQNLPSQQIQPTTANAVPSSSNLPTVTLCSSTPCIISPNNSPPSAMSAGYITGIVVGITGFFILIGACLLLFRKRRKGTIITNTRVSSFSCVNDHTPSEERVVGQAAVTSTQQQRAMSDHTLTHKEDNLFYSNRIDYHRGMMLSNSKNKMPLSGEEEASGNYHMDMATPLYPPHKQQRHVSPISHYQSIVLDTPAMQLFRSNSLSTTSSYNSSKKLYPSVNDSKDSTIMMRRHPSHYQRQEIAPPLPPLPPLPPQQQKKMSLWDDHLLTTSTD